MTNQLGFYFNASLCTGCKVCQVACQDKNGLAPDMLWRKVVQYGSGNWIPQGDLFVPNNLGIVSLSAACMNCEQPTCVTVCTASAITKRADGVVLIDQEKCIGCRYCQWACPYDAPRFDESAGVMTKCTFCQDLLAVGQNPACVDACVMRAIEFGELDELRAKYGTVNAVEPLPEAKYTSPSLVITPHKNSQISGTGTGRILNLSEEM
jgi:anaerobic dimethyl sulfoxide reductase subunit B (iron-sulfur subunit)